MAIITLSQKQATCIGGFRSSTKDSITEHQESQVYESSTKNFITGYQESSPFLDVFSYLCKMVCPSVCPSVRQTRVEFLRNGLNLNKIAPGT